MAKTTNTTDQRPEWVDALLRGADSAAPVGIDPQGWPVSSDGRRVVLRTIDPPSIPNVHSGPVVDLLVARCGYQLGTALHDCMEALGTIPTLIGILDHHDDQAMDDDPAFVLSDKQRGDILRAIRLLAGVTSFCAAEQLERAAFPDKG